MKKSVFAVTALFAAMGTALAQTPASPIRVLAGLGVSAGGDELATAYYTSGRSQDIRAGGGAYVTFGADYRLSQEFSLQGTVNYHVDDTNADNGSIRFKRVPVEVLGYYHVNDTFRLGAGLRHVSGPKLSSSGAADGIDAKFDSTTSAVFEAEYFWTPKFGMKVRYVNETFKAPGIRDVDGNHVGISANYYF